MDLIIGIILRIITKSLLKQSITDCNQLQEEITPQEGIWCKDQLSEEDICNGSKNDCLMKGKEICMSDRKCYGIMYNGLWSHANSGVKICTSWTLEEKQEKDWSVFLKYQFQREIAPQAGKYCRDQYTHPNICDGTKNDCVKKSKEKCLSDSNCYGVMYNSVNASVTKGVKMCTSQTLEEKPEKDWSVFLKCSTGKPQNQNFQNN